MPRKRQVSKHGRQAGTGRYTPPSAPRVDEPEQRHGEFGVVDRETGETVVYDLASLEEIRRE